VCTALCGTSTILVTRYGLAWQGLTSSTPSASAYIARKRQHILHAKCQHCLRTLPPLPLIGRCLPTLALTLSCHVT
jgi:hypothetical protein